MVPQSHSKATQMDMGGPFKTYGFCCVLITLGQLGQGWKSIFVLLAFLAPTFQIFYDFCRLWGQNGAQNGRGFTPE